MRRKINSSVMFGHKIPVLNDDHDPNDYRVCGNLHPMRRFEMPTRKGIVIVYVCDTCEANGEPCVITPHAERMRGAGERRREPWLNACWGAVAWLTFGRIDACRDYDRSDGHSGK
jgi:hypothetical protein